MERKDIMVEYRGMMARGRRVVEENAKQVDEEKTKNAIQQYDWLESMINAMTPKEQEWPLDMDFARLHEIAQAAGATDQFLLLFLCNSRDLGNQMAKLERGRPK